jgi:hypothetical protein
MDSALDAIYRRSKIAHLLQQMRSGGLQEKNFFIRQAAEN